HHAGRRHACRGHREKARPRPLRHRDDGLRLQPGDRRLLAWRWRLLDRGRRARLPGNGDHGLDQLRRSLEADRRRRRRPRPAQLDGVPDLPRVADDRRRPVSGADLEKWDARWAERHDIGMPSQLLLDVADLLPRSGRALDLAGGAGRHAVWLARPRLDAALVDISPRGLALARAAEPRLATLALDLDTDPPPSGPWDLVLVFHFLDRRLYPTLPELLAPGGLLYIVHPTRH